MKYRFGKKKFVTGRDKPQATHKVTWKIKANLNIRKKSKFKPFFGLTVEHVHPVYDDG